MIDPVTAIAGATAAFNTIKAGFAAGREIESMAGDLGRWMNSVSDIKKAEELNKKPPIFKKLFNSGSVEEEALQIFMAKKKAEDGIRGLVRSRGLGDVYKRQLYCRLSINTQLLAKVFKSQQNLSLIHI